jgi:hypothetical protein
MCVREYAPAGRHRRATLAARRRLPALATHILRLNLLLACCDCGSAFAGHSDIVICQRPADCHWLAATVR